MASLIKMGGPFLAAIWVVGFSSSLTDEKMEYMTMRTLHAADAISRELKRGAGG